MSPLPGAGAETSISGGCLKKQERPSTSSVGRLPTLYEMTVYLTKAKDYAKIKFLQGDMVLGDGDQPVQSEVVPTGAISLGRVTLKQGDIPSVPGYGKDAIHRLSGRPGCNRAEKGRSSRRNQLNSAQRVVIIMFS